MKYKVNEVFYSLKGEGRWTGMPMSFIRLYGCNLSCKFCDTPDTLMGEFSEHELIEMIVKNPTRRVVITGGEPLIQPIDQLVFALRRCGWDVHLETNGTLPILSDYHFDWIACSPKGDNLCPDTIKYAHEIKFLCGFEGWDRYIDKVMKYHPQGKLYLMPLSRGRNDPSFVKGEKDLNWRFTEEAIQYCLAHPDFSLCLQVHKILNIK